MINPKTNPVEYLNIFEGACIVLKYNPQDKRVRLNIKRLLFFLNKKNIKKNKFDKIINKKIK